MRAPSSFATSRASSRCCASSARAEWGRVGVRVNAVSPGLVDTDIHALSSGDAARVARLTPHIPMKRIGRPEEVASAVLYLLSDEASYVTGANLSVSGGR